MNSIVGQTFRHYTSRTCILYEVYGEYTIINRGQKENFVLYERLSRNTKYGKCRREEFNQIVLNGK
jgi:hypothetical protein